ncbi:MAG: hypothetical protein JJE17_07375 [Peptostreptococcaceae bacterium]|nr:hypothetical protein [Peptostreptococcaceae bacterium]
MVRQDRFGNKYQSIFCKENKNGYPQGYIEIGNKLFKIEPARDSSENNKGDRGAWVKVTETKKRSEADRKF